MNTRAPATPAEATQADETPEGFPKAPVAPVYLVSGGMGSSVEVLLGAVLAQFADVRVPVKKPVQVRSARDVETLAAEVLERLGVTREGRSVPP